MANLNNFSKELFKFQLEQQARKRKNKKLKVRKPLPWLTPMALEKKYEKEVKKIMSLFINITIEKIKPLLREWNRQNKILREDKEIVIVKDVDDIIKLINEINILKDDPTDDLESISNAWEEERNRLFNVESNNLKVILAGMTLGVGDFNQKQWQKILRNSAGIEFFIQEPWEEPIIKAWINRNVGLIKGLTDEYQKKIRDTILMAWERGTTASDLAKQLTAINQNFATGGFKIVEGLKVKKQSRAMLIARDQINKLNGVYTRRRQRDAGVDWYIWNTAVDERVRGRPGGRYPNAKPSHWALEGKVCRWDDPTVYADSIEEAKVGKWKSRASIGAVELHPNEDIQCRCFAEPVFSELVEEVNKGVIE